MAFRPPVYNQLCNLWHQSDYSPPTATPSQSNVPCAGRLATIREMTQLVYALGYATDVVIGVPSATIVYDVRSINPHVGAGFPPVDLSLVEYPAGTGNFFFVMDVLTVGRGYVNEHKNLYCSRLTAANRYT
jgi:hypothetical protein